MQTSNIYNIDIRRRINTMQFMRFTTAKAIDKKQTINYCKYWIELSSTVLNQNLLKNLLGNIINSHKRCYHRIKFYILQNYVTFFKHVHTLNTRILHPVQLF